MKLTAVLMLIGCLHLSAASFSQTITIETKKSELRDLFVSVQKQTGYQVIYNKRFLQGTQPIRVSANRMPLKNFLELILDPHGLTYEIRENTIMIGRDNTKSPHKGVDTVPAAP